MIGRTFNPKMEDIANHPDIRPHIGGDPEAAARPNRVL
jgi:hypothetical protein